MSMSQYIQAFGEPDETFLKMKAAYEACELAGVEIPEEVEDYFDGESPPHAPRIDLGNNIVYDASDEDRSIKAIDIANLPPGVKTLYFVCSW